MRSGTIPAPLWLMATAAIAAFAIGCGGGDSGGSANTTESASESAAAPTASESASESATSTSGADSTVVANKSMSFKVDGMT